MNSPCCCAARLIAFLGYRYAMRLPRFRLPSLGRIWDPRSAMLRSYFTWASWVNSDRERGARGRWVQECSGKTAGGIGPYAIPNTAPDVHLSSPHVVGRRGGRRLSSDGETFFLCLLSFFSNFFSFSRELHGVRSPKLEAF